MRALFATLLASTVLAGTALAAAPKQLTIVFQGDNGGEVAPCG